MCTEFILPQSAGPRISGRTMDFAKVFNWQVAAVPVGTEQSALHLPVHIHPVAKWKADYAFMGIGANVAGSLLDTKTTDAMNDQGLSAAALWLPGSEYPRVNNIPETTALISCLDICSWAVSNYADVATLRDDLERIAAGEPTKRGDHLAFWDPLQLPERELDGVGVGEVKNYVPLHFQFHDRSGASLVLEFRDQKMELTDNSDLGVMTNAPFLDWHRTNLGNYLSVTNVETESATVVDMSVDRTGNGGGTIGLSTSPLPPARFVRTAALLNFAQPWLAEKGRSAEEGAAFAFNLIGNIAVPHEMCIDQAGEPKGDFTQWQLVRDHTANRFYITTSESVGRWSVDFADYALGEGEKVQTVPLVNAVTPPPLPKAS